MQTAAKSNLVLTSVSSLKRFADSSTAVSHGEFYQQLAEELIKGVCTKKSLDVLVSTLAGLAHRAYMFRSMDIVETVGQVLMNLPVSREARSIGRYYHSFALRREGQVAEARVLLDRLAGDVPGRYTGRVILSLAGLVFDSGELQCALPLYLEAGRAAASADRSDLFTLTQVQRQIAVLRGLDGDHLGAVAHLENLCALARISSLEQRTLWFDYLNSLAVELCEVGRLEEANNVSRIVLASPLASAYPEWRETRDEIELKGLRASRSVVAFSKTIAEQPFNQPTVDASLTPAPLQGGNVLRLPLTIRDESLAAVETSLASQPARVLSLLAWKEKVAKQSMDNPQNITRSRPTTTKEKEDRLKEMDTLGTRGMLLRAMEMLADEGVSDDQLRRALIILEGLELEENRGPNHV